MQRAFIPLLALAALEWGNPEFSKAQYAPKCQRNGKPEACIITPIKSASNEKQTAERIIFSDHTAYAVIRNELSCKTIATTTRTCHAKIITPPGAPKAIAATYRGTYYEGGYRHAYTGKGIQIVYFYLD